MLYYTETKFVDSLKALKAKYTKYIPDEYQLEID